MFYFVLRLSVQGIATTNRIIFILSNVPTYIILNKKKYIKAENR